jgi:molybdopterin-guanine dinucleotide biosynthesis protein
MFSEVRIVLAPSGQFMARRAQTRCTLRAIFGLYYGHKLDRVLVAGYRKNATRSRIQVVRRRKGSEELQK